MSHVTKYEPEESQKITNLDALRRAVERCGGVFRENQRTFRGYGSESGKCLHAVTFPDTHYSMGIAASETHPEGYSLLCDYYDGKIDQAATSPEGRKEGKHLDKLQMYYQMECQKGLAASNGMFYNEIAEADGSFTVKIQQQEVFT